MSLLTKERMSMFVVKSIHIQLHCQAMDVSIIVEGSWKTFVP